MLKIRCYDPTDAIGLLDMFQQTIRAINSADYAPTQIDAWASDEIDVNEWRERFTDRFAHVAMLDGRIVGFTDMTTTGHLDRLFVSAKHQRLGIARALLARLRSDASEAGVTQIFTEASITAKPFFEAFGFALVWEQTVMCRGVEFINYQMVLVVDEPI